MTANCLLISVLLPVANLKLSWTNQNKTILGLQQVRLGKNTEINKQSGVKFWFNWRKHGAVSYSFSCTGQFDRMVNTQMMEDITSLLITILLSTGVNFFSQNYLKGMIHDLAQRAVDFKTSSPSAHLIFSLVSNYF